MRIAHILHSFPPDSHGGTETYVGRVVRAQLRAGHATLVIAGRSTDAEFSPPRHDLVDGVAVVRMIGEGIGSPLASRHKAAADLSALLADFRTDVVHLHHWHQVSSRAIAVANELGIPAVLTVHDYFPTCPLFFRLDDHEAICPGDLDPYDCAVHVASAFRIDRDDAFVRLHLRSRRFEEEFRLAKRVLALSDSSRALLGQVPWLASVPIEVLPLPAADLSSPGPRGRMRASDLDLEILSFGGLVPGKGFHVLLEAAELLPRPDRILIRHFGRFLDESYRERLVKSNRSVRLDLAGPYDAATMTHRFPEHDLAVFPSLYAETYGIVVDEALALGLPVIVSDRGAPRERIGTRGLVVPAGDVAALGRALQSLIDDPTRLATLREGLSPVRPSLGAHVAALFGIYGSAVLKGSRRRRPG